MDMSHVGVWGRGCMGARVGAWAVGCEWVRECVGACARALGIKRSAAGTRAFSMLLRGLVRGAGRLSAHTNKRMTCEGRRTCEECRAGSCGDQPEQGIRPWWLSRAPFPS